MQVNRSLAQQLARETRPIPKACWRNSLDAFLHMRFVGMTLGRQVYYVEGITVLRVGGTSLPIEHAWLEVDDEVVDVTLHRDDLDCEDYRAVLRLGFDDVLAGIEKNAMLPLFAHSREGLDAMRLGLFEALGGKGWNTYGTEN